MNKFRVNLHSALFDIETGGDTADVKEKQSEQGNTSVEYKPQGVSSTIQEADKNSKAQDEKDLKKLEQALGIKDTSEIEYSDVGAITKIDYGTLFDTENKQDFQFKSGVENTDEKGKYIEINGNKVYNEEVYDGVDGIYYNLGVNSSGKPFFLIGQINNGDRNSGYTVLITTENIGGIPHRERSDYNNHQEQILNDENIPTKRGYNER